MATAAWDAKRDLGEQPRRFYESRTHTHSYDPRVLPSCTQGHKAGLCRREDRPENVRSRVEHKIPDWKLSDAPRQQSEMQMTTRTNERQPHGTQGRLGDGTRSRRAGAATGDPGVPGACVKFTRRRGPSGGAEVEKWSLGRRSRGRGRRRWGGAPRNLLEAGNRMYLDLIAGYTDGNVRIYQTVHLNLRHFTVYELFLKSGF